MYLWTEELKGKHRIVFIDYRDGKPFSVVTEKHWDHRGQPWFNPEKDRATGTCAQHFDFEWSKARDTLYYHNSGGGGDPLEIAMSPFCHPKPPKGQIWAPSDVRFVTNTARDKDRKIITPAKLLKMGYERLDRPLRQQTHGRHWTLDPFKAGQESEASLIYCETCDDWFPAEDWMVCEHLEWCKKCSNWTNNVTGEFEGSKCEHVLAKT